MTPLYSGASLVSEEPRDLWFQGCYLLHFASLVRGQQHYVGFASNIQERFEQHLRGEGSQLTRLVLDAQVAIKVGRVWADGTPDLEKRLKQHKNLKRLCFHCQEAAGLSRCTAG